MYNPDLVSFHINVNNQTGTIVDLNPYSTDIDFNDVGVVGTFTLTDPFGVPVITGGTIDISGGDTESAPFFLTLDNNGDIVNGGYTLVYTPTFSATGIAVDSFTSPDQVVIAGVDWTNIFDEPGAANSIVITGATTSGNNGTRTVEATSNAGGDFAFTVSGTITTEAGGSAVIAFSVTYGTFVNTVLGYTGCDEQIPTANVTVLCNTSQFGQIIFTDTTVLPSGQVLDTRLWNISYPGNLTDPPTPADVTSAQPTVTINTLATGTWTWRLTYSVTVTQSDGLIYTYTASSEATEVVVTCTTLCSLKCGIDKLIQQSALSVNGGASVNKYSNYIFLVSIYYMGATLAQECGDQDKFDYYAGLIQNTLNLAGVDCDCGCDGSTETGNHWINNAGQESQTYIQELADQIQTVTGFADALAGNISATAAYDAIVAQLVTAFSDAADYNAQLGEIQASLAGLNPNDPNFDDAVDFLESQTSGIITDLSDLDNIVGSILVDIQSFNDDFPTYDTLFDLALDQLASVSSSLVSSQNYANTLLTSLQSLTAVNYDSLIAGIQTTLANLQTAVNSLTLYQSLTNSSINGIYFALGQVIPIILQNQSDIASLQATSGATEIYAQAYQDEGTSSPGAPIPAQFFKGATLLNGWNSGYVNIKIDGEELSGGSSAVLIYNSTTSQAVWTQALAPNTEFSIDVDLDFNWSTGNTFNIAGNVIMTTGGVTEMTTVMDTTITTSKVLPGTANALRITGGSLGLVLKRVTITGIKKY